MIEKLKTWVEKFVTRKQANEALEDTAKENMPDNKEVKGKQGNLLLIALSCGLVLIVILVTVVQGKVKKKGGSAR